MAAKIRDKKLKYPPQVMNKDDKPLFKKPLINTSPSSANKQYDDRIFGLNAIRMPKLIKNITISQK